MSCSRRVDAPRRDDAHRNWSRRGLWLGSWLAASSSRFMIMRRLEISISSLELSRVNGNGSSDYWLRFNDSNWRWL